jgi:hypothetical protein
MCDAARNRPLAPPPPPAPRPPPPDMLTCWRLQSCSLTHSLPPTACGLEGAAAVRENVRACENAMAECVVDV